MQSASAVIKEIHPSQDLEFNSWAVQIGCIIVSVMRNFDHVFERLCKVQCPHALT